MIIKQEQTEQSGVFVINEQLYKQFSQRTTTFVKDPMMKIDPSLYALQKDGHSHVAGFDQSDDPLTASYEKGFTEGFSKGQTEERARWTKELNERERECLELETRLEEWCATLESDKKKFFNEVRNGLFETIVAVAEKIIGETAHGSVKVIEYVLDHALEKASDSMVSSIRLNPADYSTLKAHNSELIERISAMRGVTIVEDPRIAEGGVVLDTEQGIIDASIQAQMQEIKEYMKKISESEGYGR